MMKDSIIIGVVSVVLGLSSLGAQAEEIVFTSWGGTTQDAQTEAWAKPFTEASGVAVVQDGPTDYGKIKAMVEAGSVNWDVIDVEFDYAVWAGQAGLLERLDFSVIDKRDLDPRFVTDYSVGSFYYAFVLGYNAGAFGADKPKTWADLFDTKKFPGKRAFYKWSAPGMIEAALLADGVAPENLYPLDLDRAFAKLDTIKDDIIWWGGGAQSQQLLASAETPLGIFWNGRLTALQMDGVDIGISWDQNITAADALVIPKGAKNKAAAMRFLAAASSAEGQAKFATLSGYAPTNLKSGAVMAPDIRATLPDAQDANSVDTNVRYWAENREAIGKRWYAWQAE